MKDQVYYRNDENFLLVQNVSVRWKMGANSQLADNYLNLQDFNFGGILPNLKKLKNTSSWTCFNKSKAQVVSLFLRNGERKERGAEREREDALADH